RILQRFNPLSTTFFTATDLAIEAPPVLPGTSNSLNLKEFSVPTTPEVGRIIDRSTGASRTYFNFVLNSYIKVLLTGETHSCSNPTYSAGS
ncbi:hypothetical protein, partial [Pseudomonas sp. UM16]|uniref:hypothetical protein n=1 Tax=Pseudomonas sp. UM16 TaxID=3158962 RepID=UPI003CFE1E38